MCSPPGSPNNSIINFQKQLYNKEDPSHKPKGLLRPLINPTWKPVVRQKDLQTLALLAVIPTSDPIARRSLWQSEEKRVKAKPDISSQSFQKFVGGICPAAPKERIYIDQSLKTKFNALL